MAREYSVIVGIDAGPARRGAREFNAAANTVARGSATVSRGMNRARSSTLSFITTLGRIRGVATVAFAGFLGVGGINAVIKTMADFEASMKRVQALLGDRALGGAMDNLTAKARELGASTAFTATQAAEGMQYLVLAGFDAQQTFEAIGPALELAQAGMLDLGSAADIVSNIMQGFSIEAERTQEVVDALAFVSTRSNTNIRQLGEAMKFVAPVAGTLGVSVQETSAALGLLGNSGLQASLAGTSLRRVMSGLLGPSKEGAKLLKSMGLNSEELVQALGDPNKGLIYVIEALKNANLGAAEAFTLFGQRGAPGILSLISQTEGLRTFNAQMQNIEGTARDIGTVMIDNLQGDARIAISALQEAIIRLGEAGFLEWLRESTQAFTAFVRGLADIDQNLEGSSDKIRAWATAGEWMRDNLDNIRRALIVLVVYMNRSLVAAIAKGVAAVYGFGTALFAGATATQVMNRAVLLLDLNLKKLKAALLATGFGALIVVTGLLLDWVINSDDAATATDDHTQALNRQASILDDLTSKWSKLNDVEREHLQNELLSYQQTLTTNLQAGERALINRLSAQEKLATSTERLTQAEAALAAEGLTGAEVMQGALIPANSAAAVAAIEYKAALAQVTMAQDLLSSSQFASVESNEHMREELEKTEIRLKAIQLLIDGKAKTMKEAIGIIQGYTDATEQANRQLADQIGLETDELESVRGLIEEYSKQEREIAALKDSLDTFNKVKVSAAELDKLLGLEAGTVATVMARLTKEYKEALFALTPLQKEKEKWNDKLQDAKDKLNDYDQINTTYVRAVREAARAVAEGSMGLEEYVAWVEAQRAILAEARTDLDKQCEKNKEVRECTEDSAKRIQQVWEQAMRNVQDAFADFFREGLDGFDDFADSLLNAFKDMIANMLAAWFASGLQNLFTGQAFGAGGNNFPFANAFSNILGKDPSTTGTGGGTGGIGGGLAAAGTALYGAAKAFFAGAKAFFSTGATTTVFQGGTAAGVGALAASGVTGLASGFAVDKILGGRGDQGTTNALSGIGGIIGGILGGPLGALLGGAIGSFASNLLGGAKALESATLSFSASSEGFVGELETITSKQKSFFRGRRFYTTLEDVDLSAFNEAFASVVSTLTAIGEQLGVDVTEALASFRFNRDIDVKGKSEEQIKALLEDAFNDAVIGAINVLVDNLDGVSDRLVKTVSMFKGNTDEFLRAFQAAATIELASVINPVTAAQEQLAAAAKSQMTNYNELVEAYRALLAEYDGSITSLETLAAATVVLKDAQMQLATSLIAAGEQISATFQNSAQSIREQLMSEEELYNYRRSQIDALIEQASMTTDPAQLAALAEQINSLGLDAWGMLSEEQQQALGEEFIGFFDQLDELFGTQISQGLTDLENDASAIDQEVANTMVDAAQSIIDANKRAEDVWNRWEDWFDNPPRWALMNELSA